MSNQPIRILHTADWHLGREFHGRDLTSLHLAFFDWLVEEVRAREIDVVLMAGDIFDRALPPVTAIELFNRQIARLTDLTDVVLITGNHDSVVRMGHGPLLRSNLHLRSGIGMAGEPVLLEKGFPLAIYPIPYLDPVTMASELDLDESTHTAVLGEVTDRCRQDLGEREGARSIVVGHAFITGAMKSDSERSIEVGGSESVSSGVFDGFDYVALGHLHRSQSVGERVRYSGSPIPLSYSEVGTGSPKSVTVLELSADGSIGQEQVEIPQIVEMARISGKLTDLLEDGKYEAMRSHWLEVTLTDPVRPDQPMDLLRSRFENVISLRFEAPLSEAAGSESRDPEEIAKLEPAELIASFVAEVRGNGPSDEEQALIAEALDVRTSRETVS